MWWYGKKNGGKKRSSREILILSSSSQIPLSPLYSMDFIISVEPIPSLGREGRPPLDQRYIERAIEYTTSDIAGTLSSSICETTHRDRVHMVWWADFSRQRVFPGGMGLHGSTRSRAASFSYQTQVFDMSYRLPAPPQPPRD